MKAPFSRRSWCQTEFVRFYHVEKHFQAGGEAACRSNAIDLDRTFLMTVKQFTVYFANKLSILNQISTKRARGNFCDFVRGNFCDFGQKIDVRY